MKAPEAVVAATSGRKHEARSIEEMLKPPACRAQSEWLP